ncbi:MAG TPA: tetratricopeptide repeat protein [Candidatus Saccharimonadales bacterium]|nr:tetratricopeptide repeat protein [Candidatus Saccharimonadales bacterium]
MTEDVHVGSGKSKQVVPWRTLLIGLAVVVAAGGLGIGVRYWQSRSPAPTSPASRPKTQEEVSQDQALSGDYTGAQATIDKALKQSNLSNDEKYQLYYQQGANYQNQGDNQHALASFQQAATYKQTAAINESMARVSVALGNNADAIAYYKKAIPLISASPVAEEYKHNDEQAIQALGGQP